MPSVDTHDIDSLAGAMYFVVGRATEGGPNPYRLSIAGITVHSSEPSWGQLEKVAGNSGYSLGAIQVDLGQRGTWPLGATESRPLGPGQTTYVDALIAQAAQYAEEHNMRFAPDREKLRANLLSHGNGKGGRGSLIFIDTDTRDAFNAWASSDGGQKWIHRNIDFPQIRSATESALNILDANGRNITEDHRLEAVALLMKTANQMPSKLPELRQVLRDGGNYEDLMAKATAIWRNNRQYAGLKAAAEASHYTSAHNDVELAGALDRAQAKVASADFDPSTALTDPDLQKAFRTIGQGGPVRVLRQGSRGDRVVALQTELARLGMSDGHGSVLDPDGVFGPGTRTAVETFQHMHGLKPDGLVGPETLNTLHEAVAQQTGSLADASHPGYPMFCQALDGVRVIDAQHDRSPDAFSANLAGSLATAAYTQGLTRIDHVLLGEGATRVFAVLGDPRSPLRQVACVGVMHAMATPLAQSSAEFLAASQPGGTQQAPDIQLQAPLVESPREGVYR